MNAIEKRNYLIIVQSRKIQGLGTANNRASELRHLDWLRNATDSDIKRQYDYVNKKHKY